MARANPTPPCALQNPPRGEPNTKAALAGGAGWLPLYMGRKILILLTLFPLESIITDSTITEIDSCLINFWEQGAQILINSRGSMKGITLECSYISNMERVMILLCFGKFSSKFTLIFIHRTEKKTLNTLFLNIRDLLLLFFLFFIGTL